MKFGIENRIFPRDIKSTASSRNNIIIIIVIIRKVVLLASISDAHGTWQKTWLCFP